MSTEPFSSPVTSYCFRLRPGQDLKKELIYYCQMHHLHAACVVSAAGSLNKAHLRLSGGKDVVEYKGPFEIVSLTGTVNDQGAHLHIAISDFEGRVLGGHLMDGSEIYTTAEIVLLESRELRFERVHDGGTGYKELVVRRRV